MFRRVRSVLLVVCLSWAFPGDARQEQSLCGTRPGLRDEERFLHRQALRKRPARPVRRMSAAAPAAKDIGNIAILEDSDGVVARRNEFDLDRRSVAFTPSAAGAARYRYQTGEGGYDDGQAAAGEPIALADDDTRPIDLPFDFPYFGATYRRVYVNSDGNLTFGAGDGTSAERSLGRLHSGQPRIAPLFEDLDPSRADQGVRVLSENWRVVVSWVKVPEFVEIGRGTEQTFQVRLYPDGRIEFAWSGASPKGGVVGISPGGLKGASALVSFATDASGEYSSTVAERFGANLEVDITTAAQKFYETHEDAYDYLVFFNELGIDALEEAVAYEVTVRNQRTGYGDEPVEAGAEYGSRSRLQAVMNMGQLGQYPTNPASIVSRRGNIGDTPVTVLAHEAGHLFLAFASVRDPSDPEARPMLRFESPHWGFAFNSDASLLEGNRIQDGGPDARPRFTTTEAVQAYSALDQYLMGLRPAEEVEPDHKMFFVTEVPPSFQGRLPQRGVTFNGTRRDVHMDELIGVLGRRTPDQTVAQRRFRFGFVLIVRQGTEPGADSIAKLDGFRTAFEQFYQKATGNRGLADTALKLNLRLSLAPAAGLIAGGSATATVSVDTAPAAPLAIALEAPNGVAAAPGAVTIAAGATSATFSVRGVRAGVEELLARCSDPRYHVANARVQVASAAGLRVVAVSRDPVVVRVTDVNELPYPGVPLAASATGGGAVAPASAVTDDSGRATFRWTSGGAPVEQLRVAIVGAEQTGLVLTGGSAAPNIASVVNAASFGPGLAAGGLATIFGANLAAGVASAAATAPWPASLAGVQVLVNKRQAPVIFASDAQVNFMVPADAPTGAATVGVVNGRGATAPVEIRLAEFAPGLFAGGLRRVGNVLEIYCTGLGRLGGGNPAATALLPGVTVGGREVPVLFSGAAPGYPGLYQVNVQLPADLEPGPHDVVLTIGGVAGNPVQM